MGCGYRSTGKHSGGGDSSVWSVAYSPDGRHIASAGDLYLPVLDSSDDEHVVIGVVEVCDAASGAPIHTLYEDEIVVNSVTYSRDGRHIASGSRDGTVRVWDAASGTLRHTLGHQDSVWSVAYSPDGRHIASGSSDGTVRVWKLWEE